MQLDVQYSPSRLKRTEAGFNFHPDINTVPLVIFPNAYTVNKTALLRFENSSELPFEVTERVKDFDRTLQADTDLFQRTLNIAMMQNPKYFLLHDEVGSPYYRAIDGRYWSYFDQLRPQADKIRDATRDSLRPR